MASLKTWTTTYLQLLALKKKRKEKYNLLLSQNFNLTNCTDLSPLPKNKTKKKRKTNQKKIDLCSTRPRKKEKNVKNVKTNRNRKTKKETKKQKKRKKELKEVLTNRKKYKHKKLPH